MSASAVWQEATLNLLSCSVVKRVGRPGGPPETGTRGLQVEWQDYQLHKPMILQSRNKQLYHPGVQTCHGVLLPHYVHLLFGLGDKGRTGVPLWRPQLCGASLHHIITHLSPSQVHWVGVLCPPPLHLRSLSQCLCSINTRWMNELNFFFNIYFYLFIWLRRVLVAVCGLLSCGLPAP